MLMDKHIDMQTRMDRRHTNDGPETHKWRNKTLIERKDKIED